MRDPTISIDVVVPTYHRPRELGRCLAALARQTRPPDRVIVVSRMEDAQSQAVVHAAALSLATVELVIVSEPGVIAAMSAGVAASTADIVAFTDDDAAPRPDWVDRLLLHFRDQGVGAVGGRDVIPGQNGPLTTVVGTFNRWGRFTGNHHLGTGAARDVDVLKGVNLAFRAEALALPAPGRLRGHGAQVDWEMLCCGHARSSGWRIIYDPHIVVDHEAAARHGPDRRAAPDGSAVFDAAFNSVIAASAFTRGRAVAFSLFAIFVGTRDRPGPARALVALVQGDGEVLRRLLPALAGRLASTFQLFFSKLLRQKPLSVPATDLRNDRLTRGHRYLCPSPTDARPGARGRQTFPGSMTDRPRLLIVSHPAVLPVNQLVYAELAERGWHVDLIVPEEWRHRYGEIIPEPLPALARRFHLVPVFLAGREQRHAYRTRAGAMLRKLRPDVVFLEQEPFSVSALQWGRAAHRAGVPFGVQAAENLDRDLPAPVRAWRSWVLRHASFVAARSDRAGELVRQWGATGDVRLVPHHVPEWPIMPRQPSSAFRVGYAGRLVEEKGLDILVEAMRRLGTGTELVIAGDGPLRGWLEQADLGDGQLSLRTGLDHGAMAEVYASMDVLVLPSRTTKTWTEQFGRVLVEALWCGVPVVGSDSGEIPWVIKTTGGGRVVPEGDPATLASVLAELRDDPDQRHALAHRGRQVVVDTFSVPAVANVLEEVLTRAVGEQRHRVAVVAHGVHDDGGMERACAELIRHAHHKIAFTIVSAELAPDLRPMVDRWVPVRVPMRPIPLKFVAFFLRAGLALRRINADVIHTVGAIVPNRVDVAGIHFCHAGHRAATSRLAPAGAPPLRWANTTLSRVLAILAERWCYRGSRLRTFAAVSDGVAEELTRHYPEVPVVVAPNGIDLQRFRPDPEQRRAMRAEQHIDAGQVVALLVGGDWDRKGLALAVEATAKARADGADAVLWVVGSGDHLRFSSLAEELDVGTALTFFGPRADTERFYQAADLFVLPSAYETFSLVCFEAAACGLPLVIPPLHGAGQLVGDDEAGVIVERDAADIARAIVELTGDHDLRSRLGAEASLRASAFTWDASANAVTDLYRTLLDERSRR